MEIFVVFLGFLCSAMIGAFGFVIRTLNRQSAALTLLVQQIGNFNNELVNKRLLDVETDMARVWGIYDAGALFKQPATERIANR